MNLITALSCLAFWGSGDSITTLSNGERHFAQEMITAIITDKKTRFYRLCSLFLEDPSVADIDYDYLHSEYTQPRDENSVHKERLAALLHAKIVDTKSAYITTLMQARRYHIHRIKSNPESYTPYYAPDNISMIDLMTRTKSISCMYVTLSFKIPLSKASQRYIDHHQELLRAAAYNDVKSFKKSAAILQKLSIGLLQQGSLGLNAQDIAISRGADDIIEYLTHVNARCTMGSPMPYQELTAGHCT